MQRAIFYTVLLVCSTLAGGVQAAKLYKWVDENGNVQYSDRVPPQEAKQERERLNERGLSVERVQAAKTAEEIAREQELERLRAAQEKLLAEQRERDRVLLNTFRTDEDLILVRDGKLAAIDAQIRLTQSNIKRLTTRLADMQANAAKLERRGESVSTKYRQDIEATRRQIEESYASILKREEQRQILKTDFDQDLARLRELRNLHRDLQESPETDDAQQSNLLETLVECRDAAECARYWERAKTYALREASTRLQLNGERFVMTEPPGQDDDLSLTVSRLPGENGAERIFLDLRCRNTSAGQAHCESEQVNRVRRAFQPFITDTAGTP